MEKWIMTKELRRTLAEAIIGEEGWDVDYRREQVEKVLAVEVGAVIPIPSNEEYAEAEDHVTHDGASVMEERWPVWSLVDFFGVENLAKITK